MKETKNRIVLVSWQYHSVYVVSCCSHHGEV